MSEGKRMYEPISQIKQAVLSGQVAGQKKMLELVQRVEVLEKQIARSMPFIGYMADVENLKQDCDAVLGQPWVELIKHTTVEN